MKRSREQRRRRCARAAALVLALLGPGACAEAHEAGPATSQELPPLAAGGRIGFASTSHTCAVVDGGLQCWGAADRGQTGDGSLARRRPLPVHVPGLENVEAVAAGGSHTCVLAAGAVSCFGDNSQGQGGSDRPFLLLAPTPVPGLPTPVTRVAAGLDHSCAVAGGRVFCWGRNELGESGRAPKRGCRKPFRVRRCSVAPGRVGGVDGPATALTLGDRHGCVSSGGRVYCWGDNGEGQLGDGTRTAHYRAAAVVGLPGAPSAIAAGGSHTCAIVAGQVLCWGDGSAAPARVAGLPPRLSLLAAGGERSCAAGDGGVWCWRGAGPARAVEGIEAPVRALAVSLDHACAWQGSQVLCWGENDSGQLGDGAAPRGRERAAPVAAWDRGQLRDLDGDGRITLVCLGDSNTEVMPGAWPPWCERLRPLLSPRFRVVNRGLGGATATSVGLLEAATPLAYALENDAPDVALLAYGTNDVVAKVPPKEIAAAIARLVRRLLEKGVQPLVALVPPIRSDSEAANASVRELDAALRAAFPPPWIVDFQQGFGDADLVDRVHLNDAAQMRRAHIAARALARFPLEKGP